MKILSYILIALSIILFIIGSIEALLQNVWLLTPEGYWRGAVYLLGLGATFLIAEFVCSCEKKHE